MRVFYIKKSKNINLLKNDSKNIIDDKIKKIVTNIIDERKYIEDDVKKYSNYIREDIRKSLKSNFSYSNLRFFWTLSEKSKKLTISYRGINLTKNEYCSGFNYFSSEIGCNIHWLIF